MAKKKIKKVKKVKKVKSDTMTIADSSATVTVVDYQESLSELIKENTRKLNMKIIELNESSDRIVVAIDKSKKVRGL